MYIKCNPTQVCDNTYTTNKFTITPVPMPLDGDVTSTAQINGVNLTTIKAIKGVSLPSGLPLDNQSLIYDQSIGQFKWKTPIANAAIVVQDDGNIIATNFATINFGVGLDVTNVNGLITITASSANSAAAAARYTSVNTISSTSGTVTITPLGSDFKTISPSGSLTGNVTINFASGALPGYAVSFDTTPYTLGQQGAFNITVNAASPTVLAPNSFYEFIYNGTQWIQGI